jgi:hypothetical protein
MGPSTPPLRGGESAPRPEPETVVAVDSDQQSAWEGFLKAVQKEKISLFFALKSGRCLSLTETALHIGVDKDPYFKELTRKENRTLLEEAARRLFGRPLTIEVMKGGVGTASVATPPVPNAQPKDAQEENDPLVKTVLDVLGGEVQATRSYRPSGEPPK